MVVYPRWRGELDRTASVVSSGSGLSPLARGTPSACNSASLSVRFIPAGAGNTYKTRTHPPRGAVYPRWRGEHSAYFRRKPYEYGLSPLARGTPRQKVNAAKNERFIPAGTGNTFTVSTIVP